MNIQGTSNTHLTRLLMFEVIKPFHNKYLCNHLCSIMAVTFAYLFHTLKQTINMGQRYYQNNFLRIDVHV